MLDITECTTIFAEYNSDIIFTLEHDTHVVHLGYFYIVLFEMITGVWLRPRGVSKANIINTLIH